MTIRVRFSVPADMGVLKDLFRRSSLSNEGDRESLLKNPDALELADAWVRQGRSRVATDQEGRIVGFATPIPSEGSIELDDLFVDPDWMRRGVGRALVLDMVALAQTSGIRRIEVTANRHALGFYEKVGFVRDREVETKFGSGLRMHLAVTPQDDARAT